MSDTRMTLWGEVVRRAGGSALLVAVAFTAACATDSVIVEIGGTATELSITVTPDEPGATATSPARLDLQVGQEVALAATALNALGQPVGDAPVTWGSTNSAIASVDGSGSVSAVAAGSAELFATSNDIFATLPVTVTAAPQPPGSP